MRVTTPKCFKYREPISAELYALKALEKGDASGYEQKLALNYIVQELCGVYQVGFVPGKPDESDFLQGRQFPAQQIFKYLKFNPTKEGKTNA